MRRFFIITFFLTVVASTFIYLHHRDNVIPIANLLQQKINGAHMKTYHDSTFGYIMRYPDFFVQLPDSLDPEPGCCTFRFWNVEQINLSGYVLGNPEQLTVQQMKDSLVHENHDVKIRTLADTLIISSPLYAEDGVVDGYRNYAKYVRHRKLWFVQSGRMLFLKNALYPNDVDRRSCIATNHTLEMTPRNEIIKNVPNNNIKTK